MIRLPDVELSRRAANQLSRWQADIDAIGDYATQVAEGRKRFKSRNTKSNATFTQVRECLGQMCSGAQRCAYCEDSVADEVEHVRPKDLYPERVFVWGNYVYACGPCNGPKNNTFAVMVDGELVDVTRPVGAQVRPPRKGEMALVDPRVEDPLAVLHLDLRDSFFFVSRADPGTTRDIRARYTMDVLRLNHRGYLVAARREAYDSYRARLCEYVDRRDAGEPASSLEHLITSLRRMGHPTVWAEMKRQHTSIPELRDLFTKAPEALTW